IFNANTNTTTQRGKPCFNRSIGLCPGVCTGEISKEEYDVQISHIRNFFKGKKQVVVDELKKEMLTLAKEQKFEEANEVKKTLGALAHIHDISMIKKDAEFGHAGKRGSASSVLGSEANFTVRAEAYDIAHMSGKDMIGVMVVMHDGDFVKDQYKKFNIREIKASNDTGALKQVLERRLAHKDWPLPTHIVVDGSTAQINVAREVLQNFYVEDKNNLIASATPGMQIKLIAVVKDETHKAREIVRVKDIYGLGFDADGNKGAALDTEDFDDGDVISLNQECHRFAIATHRKRRSLSRGL
ncbi:MAG: excinuclease subunit, partial [Patescibacteria group bacterium]|nr:excinuclease subunit [Patescibacteria group bacterium]